MNKYLLNGKWNMEGAGFSVEGNIPGSVYSFLYLDNGLLPDPHFRDNEKIYKDLMENDFVFEKNFNFLLTGNTVFLVFEGLDTLCEIYLNGKFVAKTENMHLKYSFDVSDALVSGDNNLKVVCKSINKFIKAENQKNRLFGAFDCMEGYPHVRKAHCMMGWDWGPRLPDAGIWKDVYLLEKNSDCITEIHPIQRHEDGRVFFKVEVGVLDNANLSIELTSPLGETIKLSNGEEVEILNAKLWYPSGVGEQNLYKLTVKLIENGAIVDEKSLNIGLRDMKLIRRKDDYGESFYHEVNGIDVFAMGADYIPEDNIFSRITPERTRALLTHCKNCNFNAIRVWGGGYYPDDWFFDICDELGFIVFFDLAFACSVYDPSEKLLSDISEEIEQNLKRLRHHPSIGLICGNNEIEWHFIEYVAIAGRRDLDHLKGVYLNIFEEIFPKIVEKVCPYIAYIPSSPTSGGNFVDPNGEAVGDCHDWENDYHQIRGKKYRYLSEFGFEGMPHLKTIESFTLPSDRNINSKIMERHQRSNGGNEIILSYISRNYLYPTSLENLIYASQLTQAEAVKYKVEHARRYRGIYMGTLYWQLNDIWPVTSWASIDYYGRYKALQYFAKRFYSPVLISAEEIGYAQNRRFINTEEKTYITEKSATLFVTNDTQNAVCGKVKWQLRSFDSEIIKEGEENLLILPRSVAKLEKLDFTDYNEEDCHLTYSYVVDGKELSFGSVLFIQPKHYNFVNPNLEASVDGDFVTVKSSAYAKSIMVDNANGDLILEDNFFDMEKGERKIKILSGEKVGITVKSVV